MIEKNIFRPLPILKNNGTITGKKHKWWGRARGIERSFKDAGSFLMG